MARRTASFLSQIKTKSGFPSRSAALALLLPAIKSICFALPWPSYPFLSFKTTVILWNIAQTAGYEIFSFFNGFIYSDEWHSKELSKLHLKAREALKTTFTSRRRAKGANANSVKRRNLFDSKSTREGRWRWGIYWNFISFIEFTLFSMKATFCATLDSTQKRTLSFMSLYVSFPIPLLFLQAPQCVFKAFLFEWLFLLGTAFHTCDIIRARSNAETGRKSSFKVLMEF